MPARRTYKDVKRKYDILIIQGFAPTTREQVPWDRGDFDFASLNEGYSFPWMKRKQPDWWFQIHPRWDFTRDNNMNHYNHPNWLFNRKGECIRCKGKGELENAKTKEMFPCPECEKGIYTPPSWRGDTPIFMQKQWEDIPNSVPYPLQEATEIFELGRPYFTSSLSMMLALAFLMGYKRVELYGFEMGTMTEYHYQKANGEFVMGFLKAKGMDIWLPPESSILQGELYGFKNMKTGFRQNLEMRSVILERQDGQASAKSNQLAGQVALLEEMRNSKEIDLDKLFEAKAKEYDLARGRHNVIKGAAAETKNLTALYDKFYVAGTEGGNIQTTGEDFAAFTNAEYA